MGQLDVLVQTAPADLGILTLAIWSLVTRRSHMTLQPAAGNTVSVLLCVFQKVCVSVCAYTCVSLRQTYQLYMQLGYSPPVHVFLLLQKPSLNACICIRTVFVIKCGGAIELV